MDCFPPPQPRPLVSPPPAGEENLTAARVAPACEAEAQIRVRPPPPPQLRVLQMRGQARDWPGAPSPSSPVGKTTPLLARQYLGRGRGVYLLSPHPEPLLYGDPPSFPSPSPVPAPSSAAAAAASAPAGSARHWFRSLRLPQADFGTTAPLAPLPGSLLPFLHLAPEAATATGAVRRTPTPRPGYFPPPRSRENCAVACGSSREIHHHGSGCSRGNRVLELNLGGGRCGGCRLRVAEAGAGKWG